MREHGFIEVDTREFSKFKVLPHQTINQHGRFMHTNLCKLMKNHLRKI